MLAYNKLGWNVSSHVVMAGNKVKDIEIKMKLAHRPDIEKPLIKLPL